MQSMLVKNIADTGGNAQADQEPGGQKQDDPERLYEPADEGKGRSAEEEPIKIEMHV